MSETLPVLLLQLGEAPEPVRRLHGTYPAWYMRAWDGPLEAVDGRAGKLPNPKNYAGIVITGSPSSLTDGARPEWTDEAGALVRRAHEAGVPTLGVCFGHQLIGWAFGARVVRNPHGWEIGSQDIELNDHGRTDPLFEGLEPRLRVNLTHEDIIDPPTMPSGLRPLASSARCQVQAIAVDDHVRGVQFHPEISGAVCKAYILARRTLLHPQDPDALLRETADSAHGIAVLRNFRRRFVERS